MDAVQTEISEIARLASEERRELTDSEVQRLDELSQKKCVIYLSRNLNFIKDGKMWY